MKLHYEYHEGLEILQHAKNLLLKVMLDTQLMALV